MYAEFALAGVTALSAFSRAEQMRQSAKLQRQIDALNEKFAEVDAYKMEQQGQTEAARYQQVIDNTLADQQAGYAANNVDITFGSAAQVQEDTRLAGYLNQMDIVNQAHAKAVGYKNEIRSRRLQSVFRQSEMASEANSVVTEGLLRAADRGLSGYKG